MPVPVPAIISISAAVVYPPPLSSPTSHLPSYGLSSEDYFMAPPVRPGGGGGTTVGPAAVVVGSEEGGGGGGGVMEASLVPLRTPPKSSLLLGVKDTEEIFDETSDEGSDSESDGGENMGASREQEPQEKGRAGGSLVVAKNEGERKDKDKEREKEKGRPKSDRQAKRKGKKKRKAGAKGGGAKKTKIKHAGYCADWSKVNWKLGAKLGSGAYGVVYSGFRDGAMFAVKQILLRTDDIEVR
jgi:hypothetical protein